jgi:hypothetical protein
MVEAVMRPVEPAGIEKLLASHTKIYHTPTGAGTRFMFVGVFILALGLLFLFRNSGVIHGDAWDLIWPLFIIAFGVSLVFRRRHDQRQ